MGWELWRIVGEREGNEGSLLGSPLSSSEVEVIERSAMDLVPRSERGGVIRTSLQLEVQSSERGEEEAMSVGFG
jgi:hypothetical protein